MTEKMVSAKDNRWYFTFGFANPLANRVVVLDGEWMEAREKMLAAFGRDFAFQYSPAEFHGKPALSDLLLTTFDAAVFLYKKATENMQPNHMSDVYGLSQSQEQGKPGPSAPKYSRF